MNAYKYFLCHLKSSLRLYPSILAVTLITVCIVCLGIYLVFSDTVAGEENKAIKVGIVGNSDVEEFEAGIDMVGKMDNSGFSMKLEQMERSRAQTALLGGEIHGFMDIPDGFAEGIIHGENIPATYVVNKGAVNFGSLITGEIAVLISDMVVKSQSYIYSMHDIAKEQKITGGLGEKNRELNMRFVDVVVGREKIYETETVGVRDNLSMGAYYFVSVIILLLMLWGISCFGIFSGRKTVLAKFFSSRGVGPSKQILSEFFSVFIITLLTVVITGIIFYIFISEKEIDINEINIMDMSDGISFVLKMIMPVLMICTMNLFIYEAVPNPVGAVLLHFLMSVGLGYLSGCFYPDSFFPESVQTFSAYTHVGSGFSFLRKSLGGTDFSKELCVIVMYTVLFTVLAILIRKHRIGNGKNE